MQLRHFHESIPTAGATMSKDLEEDGTGHILS